MIERRLVERRRRQRHQRLARRRLTGGVVLAGSVAAVVLATTSGAPTSTRRVQVGADRARHATASRPSTGGPRRHAVARPRAKGSASVPVLMYHVIAGAPRGAPFPGLYVTPAEFAAQVEALAHAGFRGVTLDQVRNYWLRGTALPRGRPVVLTFDNGYRTQYTRALPVLERVGWVADENLQLTGLPPSEGGLLPREVRALVRHGWELDTQGFSHADLVKLDPASLRYQVEVARDVLRRRFHVQADWFCYPSGDYDAAVIAAVRAAGYVGATTVAPGWASPVDDAYRLPRLRVLGGTTPAELLLQIADARLAGSPPPSYG